MSLFAYIHQLCEPLHRRLGRRAGAAVARKLCKALELRYPKADAIALTEAFTGQPAVGLSAKEVRRALRSYGIKVHSKFIYKMKERFRLVEGEITILMNRRGERALFGKTTIKNPLVKLVIGVHNKQLRCIISAAN